MKSSVTYKHSGIPWLGDVPAHWEVVRAKYILDIIGGNGFPIEAQGSEAGDFPFCKVSDINSDSSTINTAANWVKSEWVNENRINIIPVKSVLTAKIGAALTKNHRKINLLKCCIDNNMQALVPKKGIVDYKYFYWASTVVDFSWYDNKGTIPCVNNDRLRNDYWPLPPLAEQRAIAAFLDEKTAQLDGAIESVEKSVELLRELRAATISEAVTRGLNAHAPLRDSGIPWIGKVPVGWEVMRAKNCVKRRQNGNWGTDAGTSEIDKFCVRAADFDYKRLSFVPCEQMICRSYTAEQFEKVSLNPGDIVVEKSGGGEKVPVGRALLFRGDFEACYSNFLERLILNKEVVLPEFFIYWWSSNYQKGWFKPYFNQTTGIQNLNSHSLLSNTFISVPPLTEQQEIARYLDEKTAQIDALVSAKQRQVQLLRELRASVIAEAVTGKLGIRE